MRVPPRQLRLENCVHVLFKQQPGVRSRVSGWANNRGDDSTFLREIGQRVAERLDSGTDTAV